VIAVLAAIRAAATAWGTADESGMTVKGRKSGETALSSVLTTRRELTPTRSLGRVVTRGSYA
jgi:hypothetical protein